MSTRYWNVCLLYLLFCAAVIPFSCQEVSREEQIARHYCSSCHLFPEPSLLDKDTWKKNVLPAMAGKLGVSTYKGEYFVRMKGYYEEDSVQKAIISIPDWQDLVHYYVSQAPEKPLPQDRAPVKDFTSLFNVSEVFIGEKSPSVTYVKIDPGNKTFYAGNLYDSLFAIYDAQLHLLQQKTIHKVVVDMHFDQHLQSPGARSGVLTNIGILHPNDAKAGTIESFHMPANGDFNLNTTIWNAIQRPVQASGADIDKDGKTDYLVCAFGNNSGSFFYLQNKGEGAYEQKMIKALPGATKAYIDDYNGDGFPDIIALLAQSNEGIFLFQNKGDGNFMVKELLRFPPVYGSSYFEMVDMNGDGRKDIVYTSGDNIDLSPVLKRYHGVYVFLDKGNLSFQQSAFFPLNGCYKAMAKDFDKDGDMDIAAISYFPDFRNQPKEGFVYLENKGGLTFKSGTIKGFDRGRWIVMDAADVDGDGDEDIILGSMILTEHGGKVPDRSAKQPSLLLLTNQTK